MSDNKPAMSEEQQRQLRNSMLAAKAAAEGMGGVPSMSMQEAVKTEFNLDLPTAAVPLPSCGLVYPESSPLHMAKTIDIRYMTARDENILMNRTLIKRGTVITELIKSCMLDKNIDVNDMLSGDRNAIMVAIRVTGYGGDYVPKVQCPVATCELSQEFPIDLRTLAIKELDMTKLRQVAPFENMFEYMLPISKKTVWFKFLTGREEEQIIASQEARKKSGFTTDDLVTSRLVTSIVAVDGIRDRGKITRFVDYMPAGDSLAFRKHLDDCEPGVDMTHKFVCKNPDCMHEELLTIPMGPSFFWPNAR